MNDEVRAYRTLILNMRKIGREIDYTMNYINRFERNILSGFVANENVSFDKRLDNLKQQLDAKKNQIYNSIIPTLEAEMQAAMTRG